MEARKMAEDSNITLIPDEIVMEILSRVSAKSLLRFKSVSKNWFNIIIDPFFVQKYQSRQGVCLVVPPDDDFYNVHTYEWDRRFNKVEWNKIPINRAAYHDPSDPLMSSDAATNIVNGLVCFYHTWEEEGSIFVYNLTTREILPLPTPPRRSSIERICRLGFDPINKEYKLIHIWESTSGVRRTLGCEVSTILGKDNAWRSIDISDLFAYTFYHRCDDTGFCHDGVIYWTSYYRRPKKRYIVAFNVEHEKFDYINYPQQDEVVIGHDVLACHIGGYLSIVSISWVKRSYSSPPSSPETSFSLWRLQDEKSNNEEIRLWTKEAIVFPFHDYGIGYIFCSNFGFVFLVESGKQADLGVIDCYDLTTRKYMVLKVNDAQEFLNPAWEDDFISLFGYRPLSLVKNIMPLKSKNIEE